MSSPRLEHSGAFCVVLQSESEPQNLRPSKLFSGRGRSSTRGWLTVSVMMRLLWDTMLKDTVSLGSPGSDEIRWLKPVRPDDTLRARFTVVEAIPSRSKPDRGVVKTFTEILNQHGEVVMTMRGLGMFGRRPAATVLREDGGGRR